MVVKVGPNPEREWLSIEEVEATLGISRRTIREYVRSRRLPARRVGPRLLRFYRGDVMQLLQPADSVKVRVGGR